MSKIILLGMLKGSDKPFLVNLKIEQGTTERSEQVRTGVTEILLCTADALAAGNGHRTIAMIQPTTFP